MTMCKEQVIELRDRLRQQHDNYGLERGDLQIKMDVLAPVIAKLDAIIETAGDDAPAEGMAMGPKRRPIQKLIAEALRKTSEGSTMSLLATRTGIDEPSLRKTLVRMQSAGAVRLDAERDLWHAGSLHAGA